MSVNATSVAGIATFTNLKFNVVGTYSLATFVGTTSTTSVTVIVSATQATVPHAAATSAYAFFLGIDDDTHN